MRLLAGIGVVALGWGLVGWGGSVGVAESITGERMEKVQGDVDGVVRAGAPGGLATVSENGRDVVRASGVGDRAAGVPLSVDQAWRVRIGSVTKTFTSAVIMQLVGEGKIGLDEPIETYLPGLLRGNGIDGRGITVRQILRHQSGIPDLPDDPRVDELGTVRPTTPEQEVAVALEHPAEFAPGSKYRYSNTNYIVAGMLIEKVTGATYADELTRRILEPLGLRDTYLPPAGEREIRGPHLTGYETVNGKVTDVSRIEPSVPWSAGALVSTGADVNRFLTALLAGRVVPRAQLAQMLDGVPIDEGPGAQYGLGIGRVQLPCGVEYFGHSGGIHGFSTLSGVTRQGLAVTFAFNSQEVGNPDRLAMVGHALCP
ncbi:class A beta-lactamase-related serine hydrolase [Nocardia panacis]|uniref:Class A beta-lactamase-related serine hydrolase n=1 Tax=Nocardia panacis TaxID=2340916 RepID=A0A3A4KCQ2_9NOCA|nr:serine hydrolase domain-containing protein [Nocardia panacis]RJO76461.1 class A beta-lactamase-related serine hydrolase [Nocardia panacis]